MQSLCVCVRLWVKLLLLLSCLQGTFWALQASLLLLLLLLVCLGEGGAVQERQNVALRLRDPALLAWRPRAPRGRHRGCGLGAGGSWFVLKDLVWVWRGLI